MRESEQITTVAETLTPIPQQLQENGGGVAQEPAIVNGEEDTVHTAKSYISKLSIENIGKFRKLHVILSPFTLLVGPNDAGKTTILRALRIGCGREELEIDNISRESNSETKRASSATIEIIVTNPGNALKTRCNLQEGDPAGFRQQWTTSGSSIDDVNIEKQNFFLSERVPLDPRLQQWPDLAEIQKSLLTSLGENPASTKEARKEQWKKYCDAEIRENRTVLKWLICTKTDFLKLALSIQKIDAQDVTDPQRLLKSLLQDQARSIVYPEDAEGKKSRIQKLKEVEIETTKALNRNLESLTARMKRHMSQLTAIRVEPEWDFVDGADFSKVIIKRDGIDVPIGELGSGSLARTSLAMIEWSTEDRKGQHQFIRTMDEPDYRLHFDAQRHLIHVLRQDATNNTSPMAQCVVSTHSLVMVDGTPLHEVVYLPSDITDEQTLCPLLDCNEATAGELMGDITSGLGIPSSWVYLEKAMIVVEGSTEYNYIREIYHRINNRTLVEDDVQVWDSQGCGHIVKTLKRLREGGRASTFVILDSDAKGRIVDEITMQAALEPDYIHAQSQPRLIWLGQKELEDTWEPSDLVRLANKHWPHAGSSEWQASDFISVRGAVKPSDELVRIIKSGCATNLPKCIQPEKATIGLFMGRLEGAAHPVDLINLLQTVSAYCQDGATGLT